MKLRIKAGPIKEMWEALPEPAKEFVKEATKELVKAMFKKALEFYKGKKSEVALYEEYREKLLAKIETDPYYKDLDDYHYIIKIMNEVEVPKEMSTHLLRFFSKRKGELRQKGL